MKFCGEERFPESIDDIMDWFYSVRWDRRRGGKWNISREELRQICVMKDGTGIYPFHPNLKPDRPQYRGFFLGCPVIVDGDIIDNEPYGKCPFCEVKTTANDRFCDRCGGIL